MKKKTSVIYRCSGLGPENNEGSPFQRKKKEDKERMKKIWKESPPGSNHNGGKILPYSKRERFV